MNISKKDSLDLGDRMSNEPYDFWGKVRERGKRNKIDNELSKKYLESNNIPVDDWKEQLGTTGCDYYDYVYLTEFIKSNTPQYFLECGPGVSTFVIADAMKKYCYDKYNGNIKLISVEEDMVWYNKLKEKLPKYDFHELSQSDTEEGNIMLFHGLYFKKIPKYDYDVIFIDGPAQMGMCNLDLFSVLLSSKRPLFAIIDMRVFSSIAYLFMFGSNSMRKSGEFLFSIGPINFKASDFNIGNSFSKGKVVEVSERIWFNLTDNIKSENVFMER